MKSFIASVPIVMVFMLTLPACSNKHRGDLSLINSLDMSLNTAIASMNEQNDLLLRSFKDKTFNPDCSYSAGMWFPSAERLQLLSDKMSKYIDRLKDELKDAAGNEMKDGKEVVDKADRVAVHYLFFSKDKARELYRKLQRFKVDMLAVDPDLKKTFEHAMPLYISSGDSTGYDEKEFAVKYFMNRSAIEALAVLSGYQSQVKVTENRLVTYFHNKISYINRCDFGPHMLVSQSSSCIKPGEKISITAGQGYFSMQTAPDISINGKPVALNADGIAKVNLKAADQPGIYFIQVRMDYTKVDGTRGIQIEKVKYEVAKE